MIASAEQELPDHDHLNVSGDLPSVLAAAPMFRRTVAGYDRFQVDTYVQWAEDELVTAAREREHLLERHLQSQVELTEARRLLSHSAGGGELLRASQRIGPILAAAADEAERIRAEADNHRAVAQAQAQVLAADAQRTLSDAEAVARQTVEAANAEAEVLMSRAEQIVVCARQVRQDARATAEALLEAARATERRAVEEADKRRRRAEDEALAARSQARHETVRMLGTAREERRRADDAAAAARDRLDRDAAARRATLLTEIAELEHRRSLMLARMDVLTRAASIGSGVARRRLGEWLGWPPRSLRAS